MTLAKGNKRAKPDPELLKLADSLLVNYQKPEDLIGENGLLKQFTKMLVERALEVEMTDYLGHNKSGEVTNGTANTRNGYSGKTVDADAGLSRRRHFAALPAFQPSPYRYWTHTDLKWVSQTSATGSISRRRQQWTA
ncbi:MAG: transposase [Pseudomonadota bacterium]